jgi:hypothetical protein
LGHKTLEGALRAWVREQTGFELGYVEQLYTFGDRCRDPRERWGRARALSVAYLALIRQLQPTVGARWRSWYEHFPWEDWRAGRPILMEEQIAPALLDWAAAGDGADERDERRHRVDIAFGLEGVQWDEERVLDRYELLYEANLVGEAHRDRFLMKAADSGTRPTSPAPPHPARPAFGRTMALDHRRILASAMGRLRGKLKYRPVVFELLPELFTLLQLQRVVEALAGVRLHKQNFRRLVDRGGLVEGTGEHDTQTGGRPAELFRFRHEVHRERRAPGVGLPVTRSEP